jgi:hypothetical protein
MNMNPPTNEASIKLGDCCALASEVWRLERYVETLGGASDAVGLRYSLRQLGKVLEGMKIAVVDVSGRPYDPGMIQEVVEIIDDLACDVGVQIINETVSPTITWNGVVVQPGQISVRRSPFSNSEGVGVSE